jgi:hypothetical protein
VSVCAFVDIYSLPLSIEMAGLVSTPACERDPDGDLPTGPGEPILIRHWPTDKAPGVTPSCEAVDKVSYDARHER